MKNVLFAYLFIVSTSLFAADKIVCTGSHDDQLVLKRAKPINGKVTFNVTIDEALSINLVPEIKNRALLQDKSATADVLSDWDGSSGVRISLRKGFLHADKGEVSTAFLKVEYNDIIQDKASHKLSCEVTK